MKTAFDGLIFGLQTYVADLENQINKLLHLCTFNPHTSQAVMSERNGVNALSRDNGLFFFDI